MTRFSRLVLITALALTLGALTMGADSCSTEETKNQPDASPDKGASPGGSKDKAKAKEQVARVGDSLTLKGGSDEQMQVTVQKVLDPAQAGQYDQPSAGNRFVGIGISLKNVGDTQYADSPSNGATLLTTTDEQAQSALISEGPCGGNFAASAKIAPGARQQGCIAFEVPKAAKLKTFQFTLSSGFGPQAGEWKLR